jgi:hypothetical protein
MCITINPAYIDGTRLAGFSKGGLHTIFYGVDGMNSSGEKNSLCFSVNTDDPTFGSKNFIAVSQAPSLTERLKEEYLEVEGDGSRGMGMAKGISYGIEIFDVGSWKVAVARAVTTKDILDALETIPEECRPEVPAEFLNLFVAIGDPIVMACLKPSEGETMEDLVYSFVPRDPDVLVLPALDGHGELPENDLVERRHYIFAAAEGTKAAYTVDVSEWIDTIPALDKLLPYEVVHGQKMLTYEGGEYRCWDNNGDIHFPLAPLSVEGSTRTFESIWPAQLA